MATKALPNTFATRTNTALNTNSTSPLGRYLSFTDSQAVYRTAWFMVGLMIHGMIFLPLPLLLIEYCNAPSLILGITMISFFTNLIVNMGGAGIRTTVTCFLLSVLIHIAMTAIFVLA